MGNFVSFTGSRSTATPALLPRRRDDMSINTHEPKLPPAIPTSPPSSSVWCYPLTPSLASRTRRLVKRLCRLTGMGGIRLTDVEEGLPPDCATAATTQVAQPPSFPSSARRRALLIGISYQGELLNTHQDVDRYRDVLIGKFIPAGAPHPHSSSINVPFVHHSYVWISTRGHHHTQGRSCVRPPPPADARKHCQFSFGFIISVVLGYL